MPSRDTGNLKEDGLVPIFNRLRSVANGPRIASSSGDGTEATYNWPSAPVNNSRSRGSVLALRNCFVGTSAAYCQLDIQPITVRRLSGALLHETVA